MAPERAIFVPTHGCAETVGAVRFLPERSDVLPMPANGETAPVGEAATIEIWPANYYGDPDGKMLASAAAAGRIEFVFPDDEMPRVPEGRSLMVVIRNPRGPWRVEFDCLSQDVAGKTVLRTEAIDNYGTAWEPKKSPAPLSRAA